jgi:hypothetical protein
MVAMSGHAIVPDLASHPEVLEGIRVEMAQLGIAHVTIQLEVQHECEEPVMVAGRVRPRPDRAVRRDVLRQVVLAGRDEDLGAGDAVGAVAVRLGPGADQREYVVGKHPRSISIGPRGADPRS